LQIPQVRGEVEFYPSALERGVRSERALKCAIAEIRRPGISLDISLGTFERENVLKESKHVQYEEVRFRGCGRSPEGD
jgi:hypothetical protein